LKNKIGDGLGAKEAYVAVIRGTRGVVEALGLLKALEKSQNRHLLWARSLFSIYDSRDLIHLDLPWWTFKAADALAVRLAEMGGQARVFEFGTGASTSGCRSDVAKSFRSSTTFLLRK
jgi:hypothetical protein